MRNLMDPVIPQPPTRKPPPPNPQPPRLFGISPIKKPPWELEIVLYFFLGGIAAGAYTIATIAEVFGDRRHRNIVRAGRYIALPCLAVSPLLLIKDLGKPIRFFNMLRV